MNVAIPEKLRRYIQRKVASGEYASEQDVLTHALQLLQEEEKKLAELRTEIQKGIDSGAHISAEEVFSRLEKKHRRRMSPDD